MNSCSFKTLILVIVESFPAVSTKSPYSNSLEEKSRSNGGWYPTAGDLAVAHVDTGEHGLVEPAAGRRRRPGVGLGAVGGEAHGGLQDLLPLGQVGVGGGEAFLGRAHVGGNAGLLSLESGDVDGVGVVGVKELASFGVGLGELAGQKLALGGVAVLAGGDLGFEFLA